MLEIPTRPFRAYLFDCDGTIADSMPLHYEAWKTALAPWGCEFRIRDFYAWAGRPTLKIVQLLNEKYGLEMDGATVDRVRERAYLESLPQIQAVPDILHHIESGFGRLPMAVVSGSPRDSIQRTLKFLKLDDRFDVIVGAEDYAQGKPHPEPFLRAASLLSVAPEDCLVFEDAELGVQSAVAAGMSWVKLPTPSFG